MKYTIEVCCESLYSAQVAADAGAHRLELCTALDLGGLTPSQGLINRICKSVEIPVFVLIRPRRAKVTTSRTYKYKSVEIPVFVLIRPRRGNFCYSKTELDVMLSDIGIALDSGAAGIVSGALDICCNIDIETTSALMHACKGKPFTFHRAFDHTADKSKALETLITMGVQRILSSGGASTAQLGIATLKRLIEQSANQIIVVPGGGIKPENIREIAETGAKEFHFSARQAVVAHSTLPQSVVKLNNGELDENQYFECSTEILQRIINQLTH
ncbi:MAG TPA: copper homeostasis protein CutC [Bacteroidales bacterium]|nr:copper homeostasis protein CutC [Bacteroidales bacterium]